MKSWHHKANKKHPPNVHRFISLPLPRRSISLTRNATDRMLSLDNPDTRLPSTATDSFALVHSDDDRRWLYGDVSRFPENTRLPINSLFVLFFPFILQQKRFKDKGNTCVCVCRRNSKGRSCSNTEKPELYFVVVCSMRTYFCSKRVEPDGRSELTPFKCTENKIKTHATTSNTHDFMSRPISLPHGTAALLYPPPPFESVTINVSLPLAECVPERRLGKTLSSEEPLGLVPNRAKRGKTTTTKNTFMRTAAETGALNPAARGGKDPESDKRSDLELPVVALRNRPQPLPSVQHPFSHLLRIRTLFTTRREKTDRQTHERGEAERERRNKVYK